MPPINILRCWPGSPNIRDGRSTSRRPPAPGSMPWKASSPSSLGRASNEASFARSMTSKARLPATSPPPTGTPSPSSGPRPQKPFRPSSRCTIRLSQCTRAPCFWVYAYPAFLRYAAHSAGGYWARILPQASEIGFGIPAGLRPANRLNQNLPDSGIPLRFDASAGRSRSRWQSRPRPRSALFGQCLAKAKGLNRGIVDSSARQWSGMLVEQEHRVETH